jgi:hypothetical protein
VKGKKAMSNYIKSSVDDLSKDISKYLQQYVYEIEDEIVGVTNDTSKQVVNELKILSPKGRRKTYSKGWARQHNIKMENHRYVVKVHNKTDYQLTHLLEFGHATRNGKRTKAIPHIRPTEEKYQKLYEAAVITAIRRRS